jgi:hypothetical protein
LSLGQPYTFLLKTHLNGDFVPFGKNDNGTLSFFKRHTVTPTIVIVSLPKISTTLTAIFRRPGLLTVE